MIRIRRLARWLAIAGAATAGVAAPSAAHAAWPGPQPDMSCKPWVILSAYGTNESTDSGHPYGTTGVNEVYIKAITNALADHGIGQHTPAGNYYPVPNSTVDIRNLPYPAGPGWPNLLTGYFDSVEAGRAELVKEVRWYSDNCGAGTKLVLVGYSQGAHVVKKALADPGLQSAEYVISGVVNVADPTRYNDTSGFTDPSDMKTVDKNWSPATPAAADGGLMGRIAVPQMFSRGLVDRRYFDVCRTDDMVCNRPGAPNANDFLNLFAQSVGDGSHTSYQEADALGTAANVATKMVNTALGPISSPPDPADYSCTQHGDTDSLGAAAIRAACAVQTQGTWYTWGGGHSVNPPQATYGTVDPSDPVRSANDPIHKGFDCSGFMRYVYYVAAGYDIIGDRTADANFKAPWSVRIDPNQGILGLMPGDIVFFGSSSYAHHTALYLGAGKIVEARQSNELIRVSDLFSHTDYAGAIRVSGAGGGGGPNSTWGTGVRTHTSASVGSPVYTTLPGPTGIRIDCQEHAESVTAEGYTNDVWSHLPDLGGSWISNIYVQGPAWLPGIPACDGTGPSTGSQSTWGSNVNVHSLASVGSPVVSTLSGPTSVTVKCQEHAESVTAEGITNDAWSFLPDYNGYVSNIYMKGAAWLDGVPTCDGGAASGGANHTTWGTNVNLHTGPSAGSGVAAVLSGPTAVRIDCQTHGQSITAEGITNDAWSHLPDSNAWISNIYVHGEAWLADVPSCEGGTGGGSQNSPNQRQVWASNVNVRQDTTTSSAVVTTIPAPTTVTIKCQWHGTPVTDQGYTNDGWSYLPDYNGWISNIYIKGTAWLDGIPECTAPPHAS